MNEEDQRTEYAGEKQWEPEAHRKSFSSNRQLI
jgi:hypothetical protein